MAKKNNKIWQAEGGKLAKAKFIICGMVSIIVSLSLPKSVCIPFIFDAEFSLNILTNIFNAIGSILIVGGIFEVRFKDQFIREVSKDFIKSLFLDRSSLGRFDEPELLNMKKNIQKELLGECNRSYKKKFLRMIDDSFFKIARGKHTDDDFNMYYEYYTVVIYVRKSDNEYVNIEFDLKYKLVNNKIDQDGKLTENQNNIFAKRFFPPFSAEEKTQTVLSLKIKADDRHIDYSKEITKGSFEEQIINKSSEDNVKALQEDVKKQIQKHQEDDSFEPIQIKFKKNIILEKKVLVKTLYTDLNYIHIFKIPTMNYSIHFIDENVDVNVEHMDYLSLRLFSGLNKKNNDKIHPVLKGNSISLSVSNELLLPGEGLSINSVRKDWCKRQYQGKTEE